MPERHIPVIMYHCVNDRLHASPHGRLGFTPGQFSAHLRWFRRHGYDLVSVSDCWSWLRDGTPAGLRPAVLTFDDGFRDNAEVVAPMLASVGGRGTVYVNPDVTPPAGQPREPGPWGYLDEGQIRELAAGGTLEVQSHTWDHLRVFTDARVVDVYRRDRFDRLWWVVWLLRPELRRRWEGDVRRFAGEVPDGYPVLVSDRHLAARRVEPSPGFVDECVAAHARGLDVTGRRDPEAQQEDDATYAERCRRSLTESRATIERWTQRAVDHVCFPGGAYDDRLLSWAGEAGYRTFMLSSRDQGRCDTGLAARVRDHVGGGAPIGFKRLSFTQDYPSWLRTPRVASLVVSLKIGTLEGRPWARALHGASRRLRDLMP